ncbi:MAG: chemotaxis response regulator protein-glutamate methylesterase [Bacillota bacterium]|nr:chemotaxis response regulator protein-glutamate methylesterase [Bacillota bacterium]
MITGSVKVLIVDDSLLFRTILQRELSKDPGIRVIGSAGNTAEAEKMIFSLKPDVVTMDVEMPNMKGTDFLRKLIPVSPLPVVLVSSVSLGLFEALDAGAIDFVKKPGASPEDFSNFCTELINKIKIAPSARVIKKPVLRAPLPLPSLNGADTKYHVIAIGASTGGTEATLEILKLLPEDAPGVVVVQHMPAGFTKMYAERLNKLCKIKVSEAADGDRVRRGEALIAAGDKHMYLKKDASGYFVACRAGDKVSGHCPSVDVLFESVSRTAKGDAIGVILTGMGRDGASGLLSMRKAGAYTIGQDKQSAVVYGMPAVAMDIGAVMKQAPCQEIAGILISQLKIKK